MLSNPRLLVPRPSLGIPNETEGIGGSVVPEEVVQQPEPELRKSKRNRTPKNFGHEIQLYLIEGTRDEVSDQHSYCFNVEDDSKTFDEAMNSQDQAPKQWHQKFDELSNGYLLNQADKFQVDLTNEFLSLRFSIKDMGEADVILGIMIKHESNGISISQSHYIEKYSRVIGCLMYAMTCTRPGIAFVVGKLRRLTYTGYPSVLEGYTYASWISNTGDNSSTSGWVILLGGGAISWASKK
ncbi:hypothetical protein Tco_0227097 [Tanacetum coccineum]